MQTDILAAAKELGFILKNKPELIDKDLLKKGRDVVSFYFDGNFGPSMLNLLETKKKLIDQAILDLSSGALMLKNYRIGIVYSKGTFTDFAVPYTETNPKGDLVATISIKSIRAFERHRKNQDTVLSPDEINAGVYFLISELAIL